MPAYGSEYGIHPDHHAWWIHPEDGNFMIDGNDGGMAITRDGGKTWRFIGNLPVAQFYHISVDNEFPYNVYGGMQDNGSWRGPAYVWKTQGIRNSYWQEIAFGDGFDVVPDKDNSRYGYAMSQQGYVQRYDWITGDSYSVRPTHPDPDMKLRFNWNSAIAQDPFHSSSVYFGSQFVHKSTDKGLTWEIISPDLTTNNPNKQKQSESGGLTMDATGAENHCTILVIEPSPVEKGTLWTGSDDGKVHITRDGGNTWTDISKGLKGLPEGSWIAQIKASNKNKGEALLIANDYRRFNYAPYAYRTKNYGKTWERIVDEKDVESFTLSIIEDIKEPGLLFLGTDDGLYISFDAGHKWTKWTKGYPTVPTADLAIHPREHDLIIGTFGRAAWVLDDIRPLREIAQNINILQEEIVLFDPPTAYQAAYQQPTGSRFGGHAMYSGDNRQAGAMITYYLNKKEEKNKKEAPEEDKTNEGNRKTTKDTVKLKIYDGDRLIRTLKYKTPKENGIHRIFWNMDEKGADSPGRIIHTAQTERSGVSVKPGTYTIKIIYGDLCKETSVTVESDPRLNISLAGINEKYTAYKTLESYQQTTADAVKQLVESKHTASDYQKDLEKLDKKKYIEEIKASKEISKKIDSVINIYLGKIDKRQGITRSTDPTVSSRISSARYYVASRPEGITATEKRLMAQAKEALEAALKTTNTFFHKEWAAYREKMKAAEFSRFKKTETFNINP